ncbi:hypothetical protein GTO10_02490 [Candidatus Saccharibacteria bacterium]|nr:hypothetical protein [Candidatus Saccharibacteria bacterium]
MTAKTKVRGQTERPNGRGPGKLEFKGGDRISFDGQEDVLVITLRCPFCNGKPVPTPTTRVWRPHFKQLKKAIEVEPTLADLIEVIDRNGKPFERPKLLCGPHGLKVKEAGIRTERFHEILEGRRAKRFGDLGAELQDAKKRRG